MPPLAGNVPHVQIEVLLQTKLYVLCPLNLPLPDQVATTYLVKVIKILMTIIVLKIVVGQTKVGMGDQVYKISVPF